MKYSPVSEIIEEIRRGHFIILQDDKDRENEADLVIAAQFCTSSAVNFMIKKGGGLICVPLAGSILDRLEIPLMVGKEKNTEFTGCNFTISVDSSQAGTGISAKDRALTIHALIDARSTPQHFHRPGHIFPLRAAKGRVLARQGHTEAAIELCRLAGLHEAAVICEILDGRGEPARGKYLQEFSRQHSLKASTIQGIIDYLQH